MKDSLWLGTETAYYEALDARQKLDEKMSSRVNHEDNDEPERSIFLSVVDEVGIITVQGNLLDGSFGRYGQYFGIVGYGDIQEALIQAVSSPDVRSILMVYKSGGGAVAGCAETAQLILNVDKLKPVITYSPSSMCSAALWLGSSGRKIIAAPTALIGSIGVLQVVVSRHRQLKDEGVDAIVVRSGEFKALGHAVDPMTEAAVAEVQSKVSYMSTLFMGHIAQRRGVSLQAGEARFGQGRTFIGEQAMAVGLVDEISTYSQAFALSKSSAPADNNNKIFASTTSTSGFSGDNSEQPKGQTPMSKKTNHIPSEAELLALAQGINLTDAEKPAADDGEEGGNKGDGEEGAGGEAAALDAEAVAALQADLVTANAEVARMTAEMAAATTDAAAKAEELTAKTAELAAMAEDLSAVSEIVRGGLKSMCIPLNADSAKYVSQNGKALATAHAEVSDLFKTKFKTGGVAAPNKSVKPEVESGPAAVNPLFAAAAQLNATRKGN